MEKRTEVLRITQREEKLIALFRKYTHDEIRNEVSNALLEASCEDSDFPILKELYDIYPKIVELIGIPELMESSFITKEYIEILTQAMSSNRNILVCGGTKMGKTTLMRALLPLQSTGTFLLVAPTLDSFGLSSESNKFIKNENKELIFGRDLDLAAVLAISSNTSKVRRLVLDEIRSAKDVFGMSTVLDSGASVLATMHGQNFPTRFKSFPVGADKTLLRNTLHEHNFLIVDITMDKHRKRKIDNIYEFKEIEKIL